MLSGRRTRAEVGVLRLPADAPRTVLVTVSRDLPAALPASSSSPQSPRRGAAGSVGTGQPCSTLHPRHTQSLETAAGVDVGLAWLDSCLTKGKTCSEVSGQGASEPQKQLLLCVNQGASFHSSELCLGSGAKEEHTRKRPCPKGVENPLHCSAVLGILPI